jgi:hypothetical protein
MTTNTLVHHHAKGISWHFQGATATARGACAPTTTGEGQTHFSSRLPFFILINKLTVEYMQLNDSPLDWKRRSALDKAGLIIARRASSGALARATEAAGKFEKS